MIEKRLLVAPAVAAGMVLVVLTFGRGLISRFQDEWSETRGDLTARLSSRGTPSVAKEAAMVAAPSAAAVPKGVGNVRVADEGESAAVVQAERETPVEESPAPPDLEVVRESAKAEIAALGLLYDELAEVLVAIQEAQTDREAKRQAQQAVTMARLSKRQDMERFGIPAAGEREWEVQGAWRAAWRAKARVERDIAEARETLARISGG